MFIVIDGPNGAGKTTIIQNLAKKGYDTLSSPNGTPLAQFLRPVCRGTDEWVGMDKTIQFLCFSAARFDEYIQRVHNKKEIIIADRWWTSTYVYQVMLQGMSCDFMEHTIHPEEKIDCVIILGGDSDTLIKRVSDERAKNPKHGICTWTKETETMRKLNEIYDKELPLYLTAKNIPWHKIDTTNQSIEEVEHLVESLIKSKIN